MDVVELRKKSKGSRERCTPIELDEDLQYECVRFACKRCQFETTQGITTKLVERHQDHFEMVEIEIEILRTGEVWVIQPIPQHRC